MTDLEISGEPEGGVAPATPSQVQPATSSQAVSDYELLSKKIVDLEGQVRSLQSGKDKGTFNVQKRVDALEETIAKYEELRGEGLSRARAVKEMKLESLLEGQTPEENVPASPPKAHGSEPAAQTSPDMAAVLTVLDLQANDPQVIDALRLPYKEQLGALKQLAEQRKQAPNPALVQDTGGGGTVLGTDDIESVTKKLAEMRSRPAYQVNAAEYNALYDKLKQLQIQQATK